MLQYKIFVVFILFLNEANVVPPSMPQMLSFFARLLATEVVVLMLQSSEREKNAAILIVTSIIFPLW
jgi:hypothetical protein